ncbi:hypothetical protein B0H13DRAFT_2340896 [Mycena leptocephala]|nr:hypothetical protein B0H13DRAFT_2340896 [Mycena leptocephala]
MSPISAHSSCSAKSTASPSEVQLASTLTTLQPRIWLERGPGLSTSHSVYNKASSLKHVRPRMMLGALLAFAQFCPCLWMLELSLDATFYFDGVGHVDLRLPFGSSPFTFNLFAEALHWIPEHLRESEHPSTTFSTFGAQGSDSIAAAERDRHILRSACTAGNIQIRLDTISGQVHSANRSSATIPFQNVMIVYWHASSNELREAALRHLKKKGGGYIQIPHDRDPVNEFKKDNLLFLMIYPTLFPYGIGGPEDVKRPVVCTNRMTW